MGCARGRVSDCLTHRQPPKHVCQAAIAAAVVIDVDAACTGDSLLVLPAFHLPLANITFNITTKLPGGRSSLFHHVFPILTEPPPAHSPPQELVDVFSLMKCEGWALAIDIAVNSDKTFAHGRSGASSAAAAAAAAGSGNSSGSSSGLAAASAAGALLGAPSGAAGSCWHYYQPYTLPHAYIGEFQIKYIIDMVDGFVNAHPIVRFCRKLKPYYVRDRRPEAAAAARAVAAVRSTILQMPLLKQRIEINLTADVFRVHHDAQDADDPSDMVYIALSRYAACSCEVRIECVLTTCSAGQRDGCAGMQPGPNSTSICITPLAQQVAKQQHCMLLSLPLCLLISCCAVCGTATRSRTRGTSARCSSATAAASRTPCGSSWPACQWRRTTCRSSSPRATSS